MLTPEEFIKELACADGTEPTGPVSAWPKDRNDALHRREMNRQRQAMQAYQEEEKVTLKKMAGGVVRTGLQAMRNGKVSKEVREARMDTCRNCEFFQPDSKRCSLCGCFMEAKTWVAGRKDTLCPKDRWSK